MDIFSIENFLAAIFFSFHLIKQMQLTDVA